MCKERKCFSIKLAQYLCNEGFVLLRTEPNRKKPWLNVFVFKDTDALQTAFDAYFAKRQ